MNTAIGQPRLLIPVLLALTYNRWNTLYAEQYGYHLDLYGMLVGFFTYKLAVLGRQGLQLLSDLSDNSSKDGSGDGTVAGSAGSQDRNGDDAMTLDRIFVRKVISE
jgi:ATP synthase protein I